MNEPPQYEYPPAGNAGFPAYNQEPSPVVLETKDQRRKRVAEEEAQQVPGIASSWIVSLGFLLSPLVIWFGWSLGIVPKVVPQNLIWFAIILICLWGSWWALTIVANIQEMISHRARSSSVGLFLTLGAPFIWLAIAGVYMFYTGLGMPPMPEWPRF